ncbi:hypothetical protein KKE92_04875 [Candidatus Micrarchaeota archaeon]|nr:hypothetical protein [Candidatus Micrarchaeota archaeon]
MSKSDKETFIFGAGLTKAFFPDAPLLRMDTDELENKIGPLLKVSKYSHSIYESEKRLSEDGKINIENLMTRLVSKMPYDKPSERNELGVLLDSIEDFLINKINNIKRESSNSVLFKELADYCFKNSVDCVTFNYDDLFDEELHKLNPVMDLGSDGAKKPYWHPDGGYGFFCRPSTSMVMDSLVEQDTTAMKLLKLHGSVNWYVKKGYDRRSLPIDALVHKENWCKENVSPYTGQVIPYSSIDYHLDEKPMIIPPTLGKAEISEKQIINLIWSLARKTLQDSSKITFVGYSMPLTDATAKFLFTETLWDKEIFIITSPKERASQKELITAYKRVFPKLTEENFIFSGAVDWVNNLIEK